MSKRKASSTAECPNMSYDQALQSRFVLAGCTYEVSTCSVEVLQQLVRAGLPDEQDKRCYRKRLALQALLMLLSTDSDELTRWYVIEELLTLKIKVQFAA